MAAVSVFIQTPAVGPLTQCRHLAGFKTLLSTVSTEENPQLTPSITVGRRASFWNFARADYQAAYINHQHTFLATADLDLWRSCGLQLPSSGNLYDDALAIKNDPSHCRELAELVSHTLLWLLLRVMNFLATSDTDTPPVRHTEWLLLTRQLDEWHASLPQTFQPCAQIKYPLRNSPSHLTEVFFTMPVCAATVQLYHFARILLLLHKPTDMSDAVDTKDAILTSFLASSAAALKHAHQIIGIALGRPPPAVRVEMLLPLYITGVCLEEDEERKVLLELLRAIEMDTGCETEGRCRELTRRWEWSMLDGVGAGAMVS